MSDLFASGRIADLILAIMAIEGVALVASRRAFGGSMPLRELLPNLAAGAFLVLALRGALVAAPWPWIALSLVGALVSHLLDVHQRLRPR